MNLKTRLSAAALLAASLGLGSVGHATLITIYGDYSPGPRGPEISYDATIARGQLYCSISCEGLTSSLMSGDYTADVPTLGSASGWSSDAADLFYLPNNSVATELSAINEVADTIFNRATQTDTGGVGSYEFTTMHPYLLFTIGASPDNFFIRNTSGQAQTYRYTAFSGLGSGLSHVTSVPEPGALSLFGIALLGVGMSHLRARKSASSS